MGKIPTALEDGRTIEREFERVEERSRPTVASARATGPKAVDFGQATYTPHPSLSLTHTTSHARHSFKDQIKILNESLGRIPDPLPV